MSCQQSCETGPAETVSEIKCKLQYFNKAHKIEEQKTELLI